jgi:hypothetical protein
MEQGVCGTGAGQALSELAIYETPDLVADISTLKVKFLLNNIYKSSPYHTGNTLRLRYKAQPVNAV